MKIRPNETLLALSECPALLAEKFGNRVHIASIYRWIKKGIAGVKLETLFVGGRRYTSKEALDRFILESTHAKEIRKFDSEKQAANQARLEKQAKQIGI